MRRSTPSSTAQDVAPARSHLTWPGVLDDPWAETMLRPRWALIGRALRTRAPAGMGGNRAFDTGWSTRRMLTAPELARHYLAGTDLPTTGIKPTAFALTATRHPVPASR